MLKVDQAYFQARAKNNERRIEQARARSQNAHATFELLLSALSRD